MVGRKSNPWRVGGPGLPEHPPPVRSTAQRGVDVVEGAADDGAERLHDGDAGDQDRGEHDRIVDRPRAGYAGQELADSRGERLHEAALSGVDPTSTRVANSL